MSTTIHLPQFAIDKRPPLYEDLFNAHMHLQRDDGSLMLNKEQTIWSRYCTRSCCYELFILRRGDSYPIGKIGLISYRGKPFTTYRMSAKVGEYTSKFMWLFPWKFDGKPQTKLMTTARIVRSIYDPKTFNQNRRWSQYPNQSGLFEWPSGGVDSKRPNVLVDSTGDTVSQHQQIAIMGIKRTMTHDEVFQARIYHVLSKRESQPSLERWIKGIHMSCLGIHGLKINNYKFLQLAHETYSAFDTASKDMGLPFLALPMAESHARLGMLSSGYANVSILRPQFLGDFQDGNQRTLPAVAVSRVSPNRREDYWNNSDIIETTFAVVPPIGNPNLSFPPGGDIWEEHGSPSQYGNAIGVDEPLERVLGMQPPTPWKKFLATKKGHHIAGKTEAYRALEGHSGRKASGFIQDFTKLVMESLGTGKRGPRSVSSRSRIAREILQDFGDRDDLVGYVTLPIEKVVYSDHPEEQRLPEAVGVDDLLVEIGIDYQMEQLPA